MHLGTDHEESANWTGLPDDISRQIRKLRKLGFYNEKRVWIV